MKFALILTALISMAFCNVHATDNKIELEDKNMTYPNIEEDSTTEIFAGALQVYKDEFDALTDEEIAEMQAEASKWTLAPTLIEHGVLLFPHVHIKDDGYMLIAVINAILDSKKSKVVALSIAHPRSAKLQKAKMQMGTNPAGEIENKELRGIFDAGSAWGQDHSLYGFRRMLKLIAEKRGIPAPTLAERYINLAGLDPQTMPGIEELEELVKDEDCAIVSTGDLCHHGIAYGDAPSEVYDPDQKAVNILKKRIETSLQLIDDGEYKEFIEYSYGVTHSDWTDVGVVIRYLLGPMKSTILSTVPSDFSVLYKSETPTWVLGSLIKIEPNQ